MEKQPSADKKAKIDILEQIGSFAQEKPKLVIWGTVVITLLFFIPLVFMTTDERASNNPGGEVFDNGKEIDDKLPSSTHTIGFIIESRDGDMLRQKELWELFQNEEKLRGSKTGEILYTRYDVESGRMSFGVYTIADAVQIFFLMNPGFGVTLENATDEQVKIAVHYILAAPESSGLIEGFSEKRTNETRTIENETVILWSCPALIFGVNMDNAMLPKEETTGLTTDAGGPKHQEYNRDVQDLLRGNEKSYKLWGIAIDLDLEAEEEGALSFPLIIIAMAIIILVVYLYFRSKDITLLTALGLGMLIVWLKGFSNLIGLNSSLTLDILVPISIMVLGVDYAIHSVHRYQEELHKGTDPGTSLKNAFAGVGGALILAMLSTVVAFISNVTSGIEEVIGFGIAASFAIVAALIIMGGFVPTSKMWLDSRDLAKERGKEKKNRKEKDVSSEDQVGKQHDEGISRIVCSVSDRKEILLVMVVLISIVSGYFATSLEGKLEPKEYFDPESDFVVSLETWEEHAGDAGGEGASIYIKGDLSDPLSLEAIRQMIENMQDDEMLGRDLEDGRVNVDAEIFDFLQAVLDSKVAIERIEASSPGINITDDDGDGIPDSAGQIRVIYDYIVQNGVPLTETILHYEANLVRESLFHDPSGAEEDATVISISVSSVEQTEITKSRKDLEKDMKALDDVDSITFYGLAGSGYEREVTLDSYTDSLNSSIIIAVILCFFILVYAFRSIKYALVTIIPVALVAVWLYGFMYLAGFHLNYVTVTIAAISIGVGIDYSVHITARFRQELETAPDKRAALFNSSGHTGAALFGSAMSTMFGFAVIAFAPMPMFASFGLLTALMILMAFVASLFVLPSMLLLVAEDHGEKNVKQEDKLVEEEKEMRQENNPAEESKDVKLEDNPVEESTDVKTENDLGEEGKNMIQEMQGEGEEESGRE